jgi:hypothetical protein
MNVNRLLRWIIALPLLAALAGCSSPSATDPKLIAKRRTERSAAYAALSDDHRSQVDSGQIKVGMNEDAVYIAWGVPAQVLRSGDSSGERTTWLFHSSTTDEYLFWRYREVPRKDGTVFLERFLDRDYNYRDYVSAELVFSGGQLQSWRMLPKPSGNTIYSPAPNFPAQSQ